MKSRKGEQIFPPDGMKRINISMEVYFVIYIFYILS